MSLRLAKLGFLPPPIPIPQHWSMTYPDFHTQFELPGEYAAF